MCAGREGQDPLTASPQRVWDTTAVSDQDLMVPCICDVLTTPDGRLLVSDYINQAIKVVSAVSPHSVSRVNLDDGPDCFAALSDGLMALTASNKRVYLLDVTGHVTVKSRMQTARQYVGVADGPSDDTLIVSCMKDSDGPACVDVIRRDGEMVRRIAEGKTPVRLKRPAAICVMEGHVMIPDFEYNCVYKVEVTTGHLADTLKHPELKTPGQVAADGRGNLYVSSEGGKSVFVLAASGQWRRLLHGPQHSDKDYVRSTCLCLTKSGLAVVWRNKQDADIVIVYNLA